MGRECIRRVPHSNFQEAKITRIENMNLIISSLEGREDRFLVVHLSKSHPNQTTKTLPPLNMMQPILMIKLVLAIPSAIFPSENETIGMLQGKKIWINSKTYLRYFHLLC